MPLLDARRLPEMLLEFGVQFQNYPSSGPQAGSPSLPQAPFNTLPML